MRDKEPNSSFNNVLIIITIKILLIVLDLTLLVCLCNLFFGQFFCRGHSVKETTIYICIIENIIRPIMIHQVYILINPLPETSVIKYKLQDINLVALCGLRH